jgi:hypothetical protein
MGLFFEIPGSLATLAKGPREVHRVGDERAWWKAAGIDPLKIARKLWEEARVNEGWLPPNPPSNLDDQKQTVPSPEPSNPLPPV